ncbi:hypothetical protein [Lentiprolixibacter aurantiacus]|uniref:Cellobiose phosphorylase n=1 Tax=Lentiprolixibacter aurantiacus TaxID=2993939 RepID=A0AAE3ML50_9FLAO|nr:hypothetical protein [Lentiprolixibacter aurantiacus]MCX2719830.1 hypothetical protein [Lentiprolixibacter aurantiacus]
MEEKNTNSSELTRVHIGDDVFYKISNSDSLRPFFMSIVSDSNHWMFISSNGGLTAGRKNAQFSLFPYYTDDKITESTEVTGSKTILRVKTNGETALWEPFSERLYGVYNITRNLYKSIYGNKILFEEINHDLGLTFSYEWNSSNVYGFVRKSSLRNNGDAQLEISLIDGIQNVLPYGVGSDLQNRQSNLVDAYKRTELLKSSGLGIFALSAIIVDKAEPSEALKANVAWSLGMENPTHLLSSLQLNTFRKGKPVHGETDVKAEKGAYLLHKEMTLDSGDEKKWTIVANVNQDHSAIAELSKSIEEDGQLLQKLEEDIDLGTQRLIMLNASSDGLQYTRDQLRDTRHFSNTLFNIMRGGIFDDNYNIEKWDFKKYLRKANLEVFSQFEKAVDALPEVFSLSRLKALSAGADDNNFKRLCLEYMPLKFSRRHGDPSRPWNVFSINTRDEVDGSKILDYEGNWRDIFQNWEALALSYPEFIESMIHKFLNATTFDGYNPYRVTKDGFDWETIEPDDPWSYIGYWGDHQLIYLLKFLEFAEDLAPGRLESYFDQDLFVYANVPYKIKAYEDLLKDPKDTIEFDESLDHQIRRKRAELGADGALIYSASNDIYRVNFVEKILATVLAKISNFIPEGGIWMNTQRPEWNDANNALVGNGVSMVTLYYLRRFLNFLNDLFDNSKAEEVAVSKELAAFFKGVVATLEENQSALEGSISDNERKTILDGLGQAGSDYRKKIYSSAFSGEKQAISLSDLKSFVYVSMQYCEHAIKANRREDRLYHAYNLMTVENEEEVSISYLSEMLEGQVAALSSGALTSEEALDLLDGLKNSALFRPDQYSYLLYPNKNLPLFAEKNTIPDEIIEQSGLLKELLAKGNAQIVKKDIDNKVHFNGNFKNANDLKEALNTLDASGIASLNEQEKQGVLKAFESVFNHKAFTGRSGTFFGYEGLGSIYWHMVSKLLLAVQEVCLTAIEEEADPVIVGKLLEHYYEINEGIGVHKSPELYGAFSTDPYSHTPEGKGAQQPGMTGQVKEDILSRFGELGVFIRNGKLCFDPCLLRKNEFLKEQKAFTYVNLGREQVELQLEPGSICFTYCQVPVIYKIADEEGMEISFSDGSETNSDSLELDTENSRKLFERTGEINLIKIYLKEGRLR